MLVDKRIFYSATEVMIATSNINIQLRNSPLHIIQPAQCVVRFACMVDKALEVLQGSLR